MDKVSQTVQSGTLGTMNFTKISKNCKIIAEFLLMN